MVDANIENPTPASVARRLTGIYARLTAWYLLAVSLLWMVGIEGIYQHPTPFYAFIKPAFTSATVPVAAILFMGAAFLIWRMLVFPESRWSAGRIAANVVPWVLLAGVLVWMLFRASSAEPGGLSQVLVMLWLALRWHLLALAVFLLGAGLWWHMREQMAWFGGEIPKRARRWMLVGLVIFSIAFSCTVAMIRGGTDGISAAYERHRYEYVDDIGRGGSIQGLFRDYIKMHPYLSMHAKVHPPGPIVILWILSFIVGSREAMALSMATVAVGSLGIIPLYLWARDLTNTRTALTCALLYVLMPSILLFTATSADILFTPITLTTLFLSWRAMHAERWTSGAGYAVGAGIGYAFMSLISFSLIGLGAFFGFVGLWRLVDPRRRVAVVRTAVVMLAAFLGVHLLVRAWSGFDVVECFRVCKAQFEEDQFNLDIYTPRYPGWVYRFLNPACWGFFAGIPVTALFVWRVFRPDPEKKALFIVFVLTLFVLNLLYLARGEGERSAMYIMPFLALPAAHLLDGLCVRCRSCTPLLVTLAFMAFQCWAIETFLFTYW